MKPILFNTEMVRAILDGRKTVTRRVVKPQPESRPTPMKKDSCWPGCFAIQGTAKVIRPPYQPGDTLWDLAEDYMGDQYESRAVYVAEVRQINGIADSDSIVSGQYLIMPYYSAEYK